MKQFPKIIAICGLKRSGKDTIADYLCSNYGYTKIKIANPLKQGLKQMFGFSDEQLESDKKDEIDPRWEVQPRKIMQFIGTEVMQYQLQQIIPGIGRKVWIRSLVEEYINKSTGSSELYVIPDLRFLHEYEELAKHNALFWRVERITELEKLNHSCDLHISEKEYLQIPVSDIFTNETKHDLFSQIDKTINNISINQT
jgi:dephospho-CoA kinase